jgi:hypothetical protein
VPRDSQNAVLALDWLSSNMTFYPHRGSHFIETPTAYGGLPSVVERSGAAPLNIASVFPPIARPQSRRLSPHVPLVTVSRRWQNIQLVLANYPHFVSLVPVDAPSLQSMAISEFG